MLVPKDQQIQALLDKRIIRNPQLRCGSNNLIQRFCTNEACTKDSLCCDEEQCTHCQFLHEECYFAKLKQLTKKVQDRYVLQKKILRHIFSIENDLIKKLTANREILMKQEYIFKFEEAIESIYFNNSTKGINGKKMNYIFSSLSNKANPSESEEIYLQQYKKQAQKDIQNLISKREQVLKSLLKEQTKIRVNKHQIKSKILKQNQKINYLLKQLNNPQRLKLLFRASQHNFSASKFHQFCNGISDTLIIARTEYGKTIAGYTPLKWKSVNGWVSDPSKKSFLLQLDLKEKMSLINSQKAIYDGYEFGPIFGGGHDLCITNKCNEGFNTYSNLGHSYNFNNKYALNNQNHWTIFSGAMDGCKFKVTEYEVFQVLN